MDAKGIRNMKSILVVVNKHNTARVASCWFIIYYRLVMHRNTNIKKKNPRVTDFLNLNGEEVTLITKQVLELSFYCLINCNCSKQPPSLNTHFETPVN